MDILCGNKNDEYYTPKYAITPLLKYIKDGSTIWCPFDLEESYYYKIFKENGHNVINTHILKGNDFFEMKCPDNVDYIISNPPYSTKGEVFERLFKINKPFAMLIGGQGIFESQKRFNMFKNNKFEIMYFNKRVNYYRDYNEIKPSSNPPYASLYICSKILPNQIVFEEIDKKNL